MHMSTGQVQHIMSERCVLPPPGFLPCPGFPPCERRVCVCAAVCCAPNARLSESMRDAQTVAMSNDISGLINTLWQAMRVLCFVFRLGLGFSIRLEV